MAVDGSVVGYVSGTPNEAGVSFYRKHGFSAVAEKQTELFGEETTETLFSRPVE